MDFIFRRRPRRTNCAITQGTAVICANHIMTTINASWYGQNVLMSAKIMNCWTGCTVQWDTSTERLLTRGWPDLWLTPWADNLALQFDPCDADLQGVPRLGTHNKGGGLWGIGT